MARLFPILMLLPYAPVGMLAPQILRALADRGFDPSIFVCESGAPAYQDDPFADFLERDRLHDMKGRPTYELRDRLYEICERGNRIRPKLIVQVGAYRLYPWLVGVKEAHPDIAIVDLLYNPIGHTVDHFLFERAFDAVLVESKFMQGFVQGSSERAAKRVLIAHSGVDLGRFAPLYRRVCPHALTLGYVGRMAVEKNPLGFIDLAEALGERLVDLRFYMAGAGPMFDDVSARAAKSSLGDRLLIEPFVEDVRDAFAKLDILVVPSKTDGRPVAVMECNAMGRPVLGAPVGGLPEMIQDGSNGWVISPGDVDAVARAVAPLIGDDALLSHAMRGARRHAEANFSYDAMIDGYAAAFRSIAENIDADGSRVVDREHV